MSFTLPELPYDKTALEPYISAKTLDFHYDKHHKGYLNKLNELVENTDCQHVKIEELITKVHGNSDKVPIFNNAAQVWNHTFYWNSMKKNGGGKPKDSSLLAKKIQDDIGGFDKFYEEFSNYGVSQFGSGWVWLVLEKGKLKITKTPNADLPLTYGQVPLLTMDVWEHAYYLDCQNRRIDYIKVFLDHLINWDFAEENLKRIHKMNTPQVTKLDNGLRIITEQVRDVDSVALSIRVGVGSRAESANQNGISHFLEHMAFKGTKTRTAFEIAKAFDDIGGVFNASTGRESTTYYAKVLKKDIKTGIDILIDILMNSTFPEDELEREKGVVIQEIFQTNDSPSDIVFDKYFEAAYKDQPFGKSILGTQDTVKSFTRENLNNYINEHYFGENMLFAVAGNVEHGEVVALTKDFLSKIHSKELKKSQNATSYTGGEYLEHRKLDQVHLLIGLPSVSRYDDKYHTFQVLDSILGSGMSSRLFQEVREKQGLAYSVYSFNSSYTDTGMFSIFAGTDSSNLDKLLKSMTTELKKLSTDDLREEEVNRVKERVKSQILMSRESVSSRAETLGHYYGNYNRYISKNELIEKISAVTTANVKKAAKELLSQHEKTTLAAIGEIKSLPSYDKVVSMLKA